MSACVEATAHGAGLAPHLCGCEQCATSGKRKRGNRRRVTFQLWELLELANATDVEIGKAFAHAWAETDAQSKERKMDRAKRLQKLSEKLRESFAP